MISIIVLVIVHMILVIIHSLSLINTLFLLFPSFTFHSSVTFPHFYRIPLFITPTQSAPVYLKPTACFTNAEGTTYTDALEPLYLTFSDFFVNVRVGKGEESERVFGWMWAVLGVMAQAEVEEGEEVEEARRFIATYE